MAGVKSSCRHSAMARSPVTVHTHTPRAPLQASGHPRGIKHPFDHHAKAVPGILASIDRWNGRPPHYSF